MSRSTDPISSSQPATQNRVHGGGKAIDDIGNPRILPVPCWRNSKAVTIRNTASALAITRLSARRGSLPNMGLPPLVHTDAIQEPTRSRRGERRQRLLDR